MRRLPTLFPQQRSRRVGWKLERKRDGRCRRGIDVLSGVYRDEKIVKLILQLKNFKK